MHDDAQRGRTAAAGLFCTLGALTLVTVAAYAAGAADPAKTLGPNVCAECHKQEAAAWKATHHAKTFQDMPRNAAAAGIAQKLGLRRIKRDALCQSCHFTVQNRTGTSDAIAGISCESCHSAGKDWLKIHSAYSGKTEQTESKAEAQTRWKNAESAGMIRPRSLYRLAKNCIGCHVVPHEDLVNKGGHRAGSAFDLVSWSQGEVRHNTWHSKGKDNVAASAARKRMLYLVGLGVDLEAALRAVAKSTARRVYAFEMAKRADRARQLLAAAAKAAPGVPEIGRVVALAHSAALRLDNERALIVAADAIAKELEGLAAKYDGASLAAIDALIPAPDKYKGAARPAGAPN